MPLHEMRMLICRECEKLTKMNFCEVCSCYMPMKTRLKGASCPLRKWLPVAGDDCRGCNAKKNR